MKKNRLLFPILLLASMIAVGGCSKDKDKDKDVEEIVNIETPEAPDEPEVPEPPRYPYYPDYPDANVGDFYKSFIGQWQIFFHGTGYPDVDSLYNSDIIQNGTIYEFFEDGNALFGSLPATDWLADEEYFYYTINSGLQQYIHRYTFFGTDTLRLDYVQGIKDDSMRAIRFRIFKRLEE
ncbi:MAG: hypothetical protein LBJ58_01405 [Tannerellaceae bacterium]|jgi:hypothetical protein|nr:hypothetical protein [Tannerellaceae bacterium]